MERTPKPGELYRHFKNKLYQVIAVAHHTETGEELVIYQALYGTYGIYARPLTMFMGKVDSKKYPDVEQVYRFERLDASGLAGEEQKISGRPDKTEELRHSTAMEKQNQQEAEQDGSEGADGKKNREEGGEAGETAQGQTLNPLILSFVDTNDFDVKLEILSAMEDGAGQEDMDVLCESLDLPKKTGDIGEQIRFIRQDLEMRKKFDNKRLR